MISIFVCILHSGRDDLKSSKVLQSFSSKEKADSFADFKNEQIAGELDKWEKNGRTYDGSKITDFGLCRSITEWK